VLLRECASVSVVICVRGVSLDIGYRLKIIIIHDARCDMCRQATDDTHNEWHGGNTSPQQPQGQTEDNAAWSPPPLPKIQARRSDVAPLIGRWEAIVPLQVRFSACNVGGLRSKNADSPPT
jgi:hypothetical protein